MSRRQQAYGTWPSPVGAALVARQGLRLSSVSVHDGTVYWLEGRPEEGGRAVLVACGPDGRLHDVTPAGVNVRTRVQEYGGGAYVVAGTHVYFSNFADQRVYVSPAVAVSDADAPSAPRALTAEGAYQYADYVVDAPRRRLIAVREDHTVPGREAVTEIVSISMRDGAVDVLVSGVDFYSTPRLSPDGQRLSWISWSHPRMPWDGTELRVGEIDEHGGVRQARLLAGGADESVYQPDWFADGSVVFASDRDGWWRLYRAWPASPERPLKAVLSDPPAHAEFGRPQWLMGTRCWIPAGDDRLAVSFTERGRWALGLIDLATATLTRVAPGVQPYDWLACTPREVVLVAGFDASAPAIVAVNLASGDMRTLKPAADRVLDVASVSVAQPIEFPTAHGRTAHAFYYPPTLQGYEGPADERPPLIVIGHGGPIAAADAAFDVRIQFWTTRGFAVVDVNYGGSTGYGRDYRRQLNGQWGIVDVEDLVHAARFLVDTGRADGRRLAIRGGSAGGFTVLAAMTTHAGVFGAGASYYGVSDLEALLHDSHKFEARCLDILVAPYPAQADEYRRRSPLHAANRLDCPVIFFQGLEDKVVPPNQSEMMVDALRRNGRPVAYVAFEGEQHGFRIAENVERSLEAELYFYGAVFGFTPADALSPVHIENPHALPAVSGGRAK
jgi:dipeptidyl aminopeptidase/acylaminoacyl peptidase